MPFDIKVDSAASAVDPDLSQAVKPQRPPPGQPTGVPNRQTTFVPSENTTFSLGQKCPTRINDVGITGRTDNHVHFHVQTANKTVVSMGGPATEVVIDAFDPKAPSKTNGYAMVTDQVAYHDSKLQHYMVSREGDVVIRAATKDAMLQSDTKTVHVTAGHAVEMAATGVVKITAHPGVAPEDKKWNNLLENTVGAFTGNAYVKKGVSALDAARAAFAVVVASKKMLKEGKDGKTGWQSADAWDRAKFIVDATKLVSTMGRLASDTFADPTGKVTINGEDYTSITGGVAASMYGGMSASVSSLVSSALVGGTASVTGFAFASLWGGAEASIKSFRKTVVGADYGKIDIKALKSIGMASETANVKITGKTNVQVNSSKDVYLHGEKQVYLGSGGGSGYGLKAKPKSIEVGKIASNGDNFPSVSMDKKKGMVVDEKQLGCFYENTSIVMKPRNIKVQSKGDCWVQVDNMGKMTTKASKILLG